MTVCPLMYPAEALWKFGTRYQTSQLGAMTAKVGRS
jgi:hypothetical protein